MHRRRSAQDITTQAQAHSTQTIAEISQLVQVARSTARGRRRHRRAAQKLSDSMVRDTALLEERNQLMETLQTLLDAPNHAPRPSSAAPSMRAGRHLRRSARPRRHRRH